MANENKKIFEEPKLEIIRLTIQDIIICSEGTPSNEEEITPDTLEIPI